MASSANHLDETTFLEALVPDIGTDKIRFLIHSGEPIAILSSKGQQQLGFTPRSEQVVVNFLQLHQETRTSEEYTRLWDTNLLKFLDAYATELRRGNNQGRYWHQRCQFFNFFGQEVGVSGILTTRKPFSENFVIAAITYHQHSNGDWMSIGGFKKDQAVFIDCQVDDLRMNRREPGFSAKRPTMPSGRLTSIKAVISDFDYRGGSFYKGIRLGKSHCGYPLAVLDKVGLKAMGFNIPSTGETWPVEFFDLFDDITRVGNLEYLRNFLEANQQICKEMERNVVERHYTNLPYVYQVASIFDILSRQVKFDLFRSSKSWEPMSLLSVQYSNSKPGNIWVTGTTTSTGRFVQIQCRLEDVQLWSDQPRKPVDLMLRDLKTLTSAMSLTETGGWDLAEYPPPQE